ncbi:MAG: pyridoxal-phosphate dependent enzyme, partial [Gemmatimonadota bacterium]|nr:pyridoxal-phosphate dependent enzyme [Gemmatimonadota bacterium]
MSASGSRGPDVPEPDKETGPGAGRLRLALPRVVRPPRPSESALRVLDPDLAAAARARIRSWREYEPTPLVPLPGLARRAGVAEVWCKDETGRFGIGSFKALGGAYAVLRSLQQAIERRTGDRPGADELETGHPAAAGVTVATASAGNHGRSVAWGAERFGCRAVVVLP